MHRRSLPHRHACARHARPSRPSLPLLPCPAWVSPARPPRRSSVLPASSPPTSPSSLSFPHRRRRYTPFLGQRRAAATPIHPSVHPPLRPQPNLASEPASTLPKTPRPSSSTYFPFPRAVRFSSNTTKSLPGCCCCRRYRRWISWLRRKPAGHPLSAKVAHGSFSPSFLTFLVLCKFYQPDRTVFIVSMRISFTTRNRISRNGLSFVSFSFRIILWHSVVLATVFVCFRRSWIILFRGILIRRDILFRDSVEVLPVFLPLLFLLSFFFFFRSSV